MRIIWFLSGLTTLGLGTLGIFLPLLPTVPFLLLSAFCFARSSERMHGWLIAHPVFGATIQSWQERGAIGKRSKWLATVSIIGAVVIAALVGVPLFVVVIQAIVLTGVIAFIWSRPHS
jgi:uncharacterized membrane protein YbaN (DUF454 family)